MRYCMETEFTTVSRNLAREQALESVAKCAAVYLETVDTIDMETMPPEDFVIAITTTNYLKERLRLSLAHLNLASNTPFDLHRPRIRE